MVTSAQVFDALKTAKDKYKANNKKLAHQGFICASYLNH